MADDVVLVKQAVWGLAQRIAGVQEKLMGIPRASGRPVRAVLVDAMRAWTGAVGAAPGEPFVRTPVEGGGSLFGRRREPAQMWFVAGTLPGRAAAQVLLIRPNETVVALSRGATTAEIDAAVRHLRQAVPRWTRAGDGSSFPKHASAGRADYHLPRTRWQVTSTGLKPVPEEKPPLVDASMATVLTVSGPPLAEVVIEQWLRFPDDVPATFTALSERLAETWTWAALDTLVDTIGMAAARLAEDPVTGDEVYERYRADSAALGGAREGVLGTVRRRLMDPYAALPDRPTRGVWQRMGIKGITSEEQDILVITSARGRLRVELTPAWSESGGPPVKGTGLTDRRLIEVNVAAEPDAIDDHLWDCVEQGLVRQPPRDQPATTADLVRPNDGRTDLATIHRLPGTYHRFQRAVTLAAWLGQRQPG